MSAAGGSAIKVLEPNVKPKVEVKSENAGGGGAAGGGGPGNQQRDNRNKRKRGGGGGGFQGNRGGGGRGGFNRNHGNFGSGNDFEGIPNKKPKVQGPDGRVYDKLMAIQGPSADLPPRKFESRKFYANTRLYIGNLASDTTDADIRELFGNFGEIDEVFINREKNFAFLKLDYRVNAEKARAELDQKQVNGRPLKVRFAPANVRVKVKNLSPMVSNELLEMAFSVFGEIEKALVFVDERGKSLGEGFVDFTRKNNAQMAHKYCTDKCYFLTSELRPVITELSEMYEVDEGLLEANLPRREFNKNQENNYYKAREIGPRFAEPGSFEADFGEKWKALVGELKVKEDALKEEMAKEMEKLQNEMEMARYDYETDMLRQQLRQRELDQERHKLEWENRVQRVPRNFVGGFNSGRMDEPQPPQNDGNMMPPEDNSGLGPNMSNNDMRINNMPLAPPPMPPQGLMGHLQEEPTWEIGPFGFGGGQMGGPGGAAGGNFGQQPFQEQRDVPRFMGPRGPGPNMMRGGPPRGGFNRGGGNFRGGNRGGRR